MRNGRHRIWEGDEPRYYHVRPDKTMLEAREAICNVHLRKMRRQCGKPAVQFPKGFLPSCKKHKTTKLLAGRCRYIDASARCNKLINYHVPFAELCYDHRDWDGLPCHLLKLPTELRMHIFSFLLPDKPINAWLDAPLRHDRERCTLSVLLVNRQINDEAMEVLYGSQPFIIGLGRDSIFMCGNIYGHDKSEWPSIMTYNPPRPNRNGHIPPMLKYVRHIRLQINFVNPGFPAGRPQHYPVWDASIDLYDLRDSAKALAGILTTEPNSLCSLNIVVVAQNMLHNGTKAWTNDELCKLMHTVVQPLARLRAIPQVNLEGVCEIHTTHRISPTQYFLDNIRPATTEDGIAKPGEFVLSYKYTADNQPTLIRVTRPIASHALFMRQKANLEEVLSSDRELVYDVKYENAIKRFDEFRKAYHAVESNFRTALPRGKNWMLHRARLARENKDVDGIAKVRQELEVEIKRIVGHDRQAIAAKEEAALNALSEFDRQIGEDDVSGGQISTGEGSDELPMDETV